MILTPEEVEALTRRRRYGWQARVLDHLGIPYRKRPDGSLVVLRVHVEFQEQKRSPEPTLRLG